MAIQLQLQSKTSWFFIQSLLLHRVISLLRSCWYHYTVLCRVKAGTPVFGQFYSWTRVSGLLPGRSFVTPKVRWLLMKLHCWWLKGFLCLVRTWRGGELRPFSLCPGEALLASGRIWFLELSFAQIPHCVIHCQWDKRGFWRELIPWFSYEQCFMW